MNVSRKITYFFKYFVAIALSLLFSQTAFTQSSSNQQIAVEGTLTDNSGNAIDLSGAALIFYVMNSNNCYLYGEWSSTAGDAQGNITHRLGGSTKVVGSPNDFTQDLFFGAANGKNISTDSACAVTAADTRLVQVYYQAQNIRANIQLGTVPYSHNATMLNGKNATDFLEVTPDSDTLFHSGSGGQVLTKQADGSLNWAAPTATAVTASSITAALGYTPSSGTPSVTFGTTSGTAAQGNDPRIIGALQATNNLSDLSSATSARNNLGLGSLATKSSINMATDVSGVLPVANGGTQWSSNAAGVMTTLNASIGSSTIYSNIGLAVTAPNYINSLIGYFNNTASDGNGVKINVDNADSSKYGLKVSSSANAANFIVLNSGYVGIGTASPRAPLEVSANGSGGAWSNVAAFTAYAGGSGFSGGLVLRSYRDGASSTARRSAIQSVDQDTTNSIPSGAPTDLILQPDGKNVGIGTTSPQFKLSLAGTATNADRKIGINDTPIVFLPDQTNFQGSLFIGNGGDFLTHSTSMEGYSNTGVGIGALYNITIGEGNVATGYRALYSNTTGYQNTAAGHYALQANSTGTRNVAYGPSSLFTNTTGYNNVAMGFASLNKNTVGSYNVAIGSTALFNNTTGIQNIAIGSGAGSDITTGSYNVIIGSNTGASISSSSNNILLSDGQGVERLRINANGDVGLGTIAPNSRLHVFSPNTEIARFDGANAGGYIAFSRNSSPKGFIGYASGSGSLFANEITDAMAIRSGNAVQLGSGNMAHLTVTPTGQVGIGTTTPTATLTVSGPIRTTAAVEFNDGTAQNSAAWGGYERISNNCGSASSCVATCSAGKKIIAGGCSNSTVAPLVTSGPASDTQWSCAWGSGALTNITAFAICVKM